MPSTRAILATGVCVAVLGLAGVALLRGEPAPQAPSPVALAVAPPAPAPAAPALELFALRDELAALKARLNALTAEKPTPQAPVEPVPARAAPVSAGQLAEQLAASLAQEATDGDFNAEMAGRVDAFFKSPAAGGGVVRHSECGRTLCRLELRYASVDGRNTFVDNLSDLFPPGSQGFAHVENAADLDIEVYFTREGPLQLSQK